MQRSLTTTKTSGGTAARRGRQLPPIQTNFTKDASTQTLRPRQVEASIQDDTSLPNELLPNNKRQSRKLLGLFDRSKTQKDNSSPKDRLNVIKPVSDQNTPQVDTKRSNHLQKKRPQNREGQIKPPTFVQALAKAAKRITLAVPVTDADDIYKIRKHQQESSIWEEETDEYAEDNASDFHGAAPAFLPTNWMACIFILTTRGLLLQYSAIGLPDRLPQRFIQLTGNSAAFASNVVAGRHWVVQVTQSVNDNLSPESARSRLSRIGSRSNKVGKTSMLLVMETAKQMDSWLLALQSEIFARSSKSRQTEILSPKKLVNEETRTRGSFDYASSDKKSNITTSNDHHAVASQDKKEVITTSNLSENRREFLQQFDNHSSSTVTVSVEETRGLLRESNEQHVSSELSPLQKVFSQPLLQWELPANFSPTFSPSPSVNGFLINVFDREISQDYHPVKPYSPSIASDGAPNFSVPSFSRRFSHSTKSTTLVVTPSRSSGSSLDVPSTIGVDEDTKEMHSMMSLPLLVTPRKASQQSIAYCTVFDQDWPESEETILFSLGEETVLSRPSSSLLFSRGIEAIAMGAKPSKAITPRPSFSLNIQQPSPREIPPDILCIDNEIHPAFRNPDTRESEEIFPLPPRKRKASMPQISLTPVSSEAEKSRPHSLQPPSKEAQLQKKISLKTLQPVEPTRPMTLRERRSFATIPSHLLGPPPAPPPTNPLPAIPKPATVLVCS